MSRAAPKHIPSLVEQLEAYALGPPPQGGASFRLSLRQRVLRYAARNGVVTVRKMAQALGAPAGQVSSTAAAAVTSGDLLRVGVGTYRRAGANRGKAAV